MGDFGSNNLENNLETSIQEKEEAQPQVEVWTHGQGHNSWQSKSKTVCERTSQLYNSSEMSDLDILACDENWWFGQTVKDYTGHKFVLASASPVFHRLLYESIDVNEGLGSAEKKLVLDEALQVNLTLAPTYSGHRIEMDGIPPIAAEAMLEYIYKDKFNASDFENGYSRNLLWRLWHASKAFEIEHLNQLCTDTIAKTMCEDTVFWDLNYSIQYKTLGVGDTMTNVLKLMETLEEKLYEHPNFVWLDQMAVQEILSRRPKNNCEPITILNNLLRWSLYQIDRSACCEVDDKSNGDIPIEYRIQWINSCRNGEFSHVTQDDLQKYLARGLALMPWNEMSQSDFLKFVVPNQLIPDEILLQQSLLIMTAAVQNPERLTKSAFRSDQPQEPKASQPVSNNTSKTSVTRVGSVMQRNKRPGDLIREKLGIKNDGIITEEINGITKPTSPA